MAIKWKYVHIKKNSDGTFYGVAQNQGGMKSTAEKVFDSPEEAFEALRTKYDYVWDDTEHYEFFLKWVVVPDAPEDGVQGWKLERYSSVRDEWVPSSSYPNLYTSREADAIINGADETEGSRRITYRKVVA